MVLSRNVRWGIAAAGMLAGIGIATASTAQADAETSGASPSASATHGAGSATNRGVRAARATAQRQADAATPAASASSGTVSVAGTKNSASADIRRLGLGAIAGVTQRSNQMYIVQSATCCKSLSSGGPNASFSASGQYSITGGQPWGGVVSGPGGSGGLPAVLITAQAGRKGSSGPAQWFMSNAQGGQLISDFGGDDSGPSNLNFAFTGTLTIGALDGSSTVYNYDLVIGQGHVTTVNNWWIGGPGWTQGPYSGLGGSGTGSMLSPDRLWVIAGGDAATFAASSGFVVFPYSGYNPPDPKPPGPV